VILLFVLTYEKTKSYEFRRSREFLWQGHTVHATKEDADKEVTLVFFSS
ncbi:unnamed protein product, partial [Brassica napus]